MMTKSLAGALKEWAVVVKAVDEGRQTILIRKGGIQDEGGQFRVEHRDFVFYPTFEHQSKDLVTPEAHALFDEVVVGQPPPGRIRFTVMAKVVEVLEARTIERLRALADLHIWSPRVIEQRFASGDTAGALVLVIRAFKLARPIEAEEQPAYAGCRSWVTLAAPLSAAGVAPVLPDEAFMRQVETVRARLA